VILKLLLNQTGRTTSQWIADKLHKPQSTVQRRRERLEKILVRTNYSIDLNKFGWRTVDFFISTKNGMRDTVGKKLLLEKNVIEVSKSIGARTIDLRIQVLLRDNTELLNMLERIEAMNGVQEAVWSEVIGVVGRKKSIPFEIIDSL
jgi:DNA-binding Lrp family transcriptional regulator